MSQFIQIKVRGWPHKQNEDDTRLIFTLEEREQASDVMVQLGGLFRCEARVINEDEVPDRESGELRLAQAIRDAIVQDEGVYIQ